MLRNLDLKLDSYRFVTTLELACHSPKRLTHQPAVNKNIARVNKAMIMSRSYHLFKSKSSISERNNCYSNPLTSFFKKHQFITQYLNILDEDL